MQRNKAKGINTLPDEMLLHVFSFLSPPSQARASEVCRKWNDIANDLSLSRAYAPLYRETTAPDFEAKMNDVREEILTKFLSESLHNQTIDTTVHIRIIDESPTNESRKIYALPDARHEKDSAYNTKPRRLGPDNHFLIPLMTSSVELRQLGFSSRAGNRDFIKNLLGETDIILFCPNESKNEAQELASLSAQLTELGITDKIVFVLNGKTNVGRYISLPLEKDDSLQTLAARMQTLIFQANFNPLELKNTKESQEEKIKPSCRIC